MSYEQEEVTYGESYGNEVIQLPMGNYDPFSFGLTKAKLILIYLKEIEEFVQEQEQDPGWSTLDGPYKREEY